jgi:hypothetical protein
MFLPDIAFWGAAHVFAGIHARWQVGTETQKTGWCSLMICTAPSEVGRVGYVVIGTG